MEGCICILEFHYFLVVVVAVAVVVEHNGGGSWYGTCRGRGGLGKRTRLDPIVVVRQGLGGRPSLVCC